MSRPIRPSSYAAVVSGISEPPSPTLTPQVRLQQTIHPQLLRSDLSRSHPASSSAEHWDKTPFPPHPQSFAFGQRGLPTPMDERVEDLVVPSYLKGSRHVDRLQERQRQRKLAQREGKPAKSSQPGSLSASASNLSVPKMVPSHRGMTHEIVERPYQQPEERSIRLPTRMNVHDKAAGLELGSDGLDVKFAGPPKAENEAACVRADFPVPKDCGIYYFEVTLQGKHKEGLIGVGFSGSKVSLNKPPGWEAESWAYHGDDGFSFCQSFPGKAYGPKYNWNSTIGCGINFRTGSIFFTKDGNNLGVAFRDIKGPSLYPSVGMKKTGEHVRINFGQSPFVYDIDTMVEREKLLATEDIESQDPSQLHPSRNEELMLREMVSQYLEHEGYVGTAKALTGELYREDNLLQKDNQLDTDNEFREDVDAVQRQQIRASILSGDINTALKHTDLYYPYVLKENENINFKLKCRKFVEMIRKCSELGNRSKQRDSHAFKAPKAGAGANGHQPEFGVFDNAMEIDGREDGANGDNDMDMDEDEFTTPEALMTDALAYGQKLQAEFRDDPRREVKQALEDTFALIAYINVEESSLAPMLREEGRVAIAEELNSAILVSLGKASSSAIERLVQQSEVLIGDLAAEGHLAAHVNIRRDYMQPLPHAEVQNIT